MHTEYEATFIDFDVEEMRGRLKAAGASLLRPEYQQRRYVFDLPPGKASRHTWARVRDEGNKITMSWKSHAGANIEDQKEISVDVGNFDDAVELLKQLGCVARSYQETLREQWMKDDVEVVIDTWPFLEPFIEIEGPSEEKVRAVAEALSLEWKGAIFGTVSTLYKMKYGSHANASDTERLTFSMKNPFL